MASVQARSRQAGTAYRVMWREDGRQRSRSFRDQVEAQRLVDELDDVDEVVVERLRAGEIPPGEARPAERRAARA